MLYTALSTGMAVVGLVCSIAALRIAVHATNLANEAIAKAEQRVELTPSQADLAELQSEFTNHADALAQVNANLKKLRSRIGMREYRDRKANGEDAPSGESPDEIKRRLRRQVLKR